MHESVTMAENARESVAMAKKARESVAMAGNTMESVAMVETKSVAMVENMRESFAMAMIWDKTESSATFGKNLNYRTSKRIKLHLLIN